MTTVSIDEGTLAYSWSAGESNAVAGIRPRSFDLVTSLKQGDPVRIIGWKAALQECNGAGKRPSITLCQLLQ